MCAGRPRGSTGIGSPVRTIGSLPLVVAGVEGELRAAIEPGIQRSRQPVSDRRNLLRSATPDVAVEVGAEFGSVRAAGG